MRALTHSHTHILLCLLLVSCATKHPPPPAVTGDGILLRRNLTPGIQLVYSFNSVMTEKTVTDRQDLYFRLDASAEVCETVVDYDRKTGTALVGLIGESKWRIKRGKNADPEPPVEQVWCAAYRIDGSGRSVREPAGEVPAKLVRLHREIGQLSRNSQVCAPFPRERVRAGHKWEGMVLLPLAGMRLPRKAVSRIERVYKQDGRTLCLIKSEISLGGRDFYIGWKPGVCLPDMDVRGSSEGVFDVSGGVWRDMRWELGINFDGRGFSGKRSVASNIKMLRHRQRSGKAFSQFRERTRTFDQVLDRLYACDLEGGLKVLAGDPGDAGWARAFELTANLVRSFLAPSATADARRTGLPMPKNTDEGALAIYKEAGALAGEGKTAEALAVYERFLALAERDPGIPTRVRILARYRSAGLLEKLGKTDEALEAYRGVLTMKGDDDYSVKVKARANAKLAAADKQTQ